ncbi:hypothetical protein G9464_18175 [Halostella sp. JP-L12]|uniref:hypothetical protein n=1 Tax=Halostella TaxID=1843185 RepID=UPI000EF837F1|nr:MULTISPECIES: hypothetical protein [Halostella]NHN49500.1 hypothetical protein [Halostella sp. JP-L12]
MVVSAAFEELTEVLACLESSDAEVKNVDIGERMDEETDEITANLTVGVPVLAGVELHDDVAVEAENFDLEDRRIDVDLSVSLPVGEEYADEGLARSVVDASSGRNGSSDVPAYKDPDALEAVYEEYDTFPEMTEALGADVTSETVRRYMVEYDIHDPDDSRPQAHRYAASAAEADGETASGDQDSGAADPGDGTAGSDHAPSGDESESDATGSTAKEFLGDEPTAATDGPAAEGDGTTDGTHAAPAPTDDATVETDGDRAGGDADHSESDLGGKSVAELIAASDAGDGDDSLVADGLGIPKGLTVAELAAIVNESDTLYEAKERLGIGQDHARRMLKELNLIDLVTSRLGAEQINVRPAEIRRRIDRGNSTSL